MKNKGQKLRLTNQRTRMVLTNEAVLARSLWGQLIGWMGRRNLSPESALGLPHCNQIHTFFVFLPLDVAFCNRDGVVLRIVAGLPPFRISPWVPGAFIAWEMVATSLAPHVRVGDILTTSLPEPNES